MARFTYNKVTGKNSRKITVGYFRPSFRKAVEEGVAKWRDWMNTGHPVIWNGQRAEAPMGGEQHDELPEFIFKYFGVPACLDGTFGKSVFDKKYYFEVRTKEDLKIHDPQFGVNRLGELLGGIGAGREFITLMQTKLFPQKSIGILQRSPDDPETNGITQLYHSYPMRLKLAEITPQDANVGFDVSNQSWYAYPMEWVVCFTPPTDTTFYQSMLHPNETFSAYDVDSLISYYNKTSVQDAVVRTLVEMNFSEYPYVKNIKTMVAKEDEVEILTDYSFSIKDEYTSYPDMFSIYINIGYFTIMETFSWLYTLLYEIDTKGVYPGMITREKYPGNELPSVARTIVRATIDFLWDYWSVSGYEFTVFTSKENLRYAPSGGNVLADCETYIPKVTEWNFWDGSSPAPEKEYGFLNYDNPLLSPYPNLPPLPDNGA